MTELNQDICGNCKSFIDKDLTLASIAEVIKPKKHFKKFRLYNGYYEKFKILNTGNPPPINIIFFC